MGRVWKISIPVRPKAVQSVRGGRGGFFPDRKVKLWKASIIPFIDAACDGNPSRLPMRVNAIRYYFQLPKYAKPEVVKFVGDGGLLPYIGTADITDNLAKGLIDCCAERVFENDKQIWNVCDTQKAYGLTDGIYIEFEETPDVKLLGSNGKLQVPT